MSETAEIEFVDRYSGTIHEGKPWLRGCWGPCEAMGVFPTQDPREWPILPVHRRPMRMLGRRVEEHEHDAAMRQAFVFVGPTWDSHYVSPGGVVPEVPHAEWMAALDQRGWWIPETAVEDGWAFLTCPDCGGTGNVDRRTALRRLPRLLGKLVDSLRHAHGSDGWEPSAHRWPRAYTRWWYLRWHVVELWRAMRWAGPVVTVRRVLTTHHLRRTARRSERKLERLRENGGFADGDHIEELGLPRAAQRRASIKVVKASRGPGRWWVVAEWD